MLLKKNTCFPWIFFEAEIVKPHGHHPPPRRLPATLEGEGWTSFCWAEAENSVGFFGSRKGGMLGLSTRNKGQLKWN